MPIDPKAVKWDDAPPIDPNAVQWDDSPAPRSMAQTMGDTAAGLVRGAGSIGATLLAPVDVARAAMEGRGLTLDYNRQRRADMDAGLRTMGADPNSTAFQLSKLGGEIAGTAGIPGLIGRGAAAAGAAPKVVNALSSGGFSLGAPAATSKLAAAGDMALRTAAGGATGAGAAALANPDQAGSGAAIGAAMPGAVKLAGAAGSLAGSALTNALGAVTGTSAEAVRAAFNAGKTKATAFWDNLTNKADFEDIVATAKQGLSQMRKDRAAAYTSGMAGVKADKTALDFAPIERAMAGIKDMGSFKGETIRKNASSTVQEIDDLITRWRGLDPAEFHTPEGMDALKQAVGDIRDSTAFGTPARKAADQVYNAVKNEIVKQAPDYAKVMRDYEEASRMLDDVTKTFSLGEKTPQDTAIRKLQSLMRNNVQTNYGRRTSLAEELERQGGVSLMPAIAGQAMNSWMPRGMVGSLQKVGAGALGGASVLQPSLLPMFGLAPLASPRVVGGASYGLGRLAGMVGDAGSSAAQLTPQQARELIQGALRVSPVIGLGSLGALPQTR